MVQQHEIPSNPPQLQNMTTIGPVTIERADTLPSTGREILGKVILILGPTGAGKSTFVEALANDTSLGISSNRLEGFTQFVSMYRVCNVMLESVPIYVVDVPGFADTKISAMSIVTMIKTWMKKHRVRWFDCILYLTPINVPRLPGSHRQVLRTFQALTGINVANIVTVVTTMWDRISGESGWRRAEMNFNQLHDDDYLDQGSKIVKFTNGQESALSVLDAAFTEHGSILFLHVEDFVNESQPLHQTPFAIHLFEDLQARITNLQLQRSIIQAEMKETSGRSDKQLMTVLRLQLKEVDTYLVKFEREMGKFAAWGDLEPHVWGPFRTIQSSFIQAKHAIKSWGKAAGKRRED